MSNSDTEVLSHVDFSFTEPDNSLTSDDSIHSDSYSESDNSVTSDDFYCRIKCGKKFVRNYLANWAVKNQLSRVAVNEILHLLKVMETRDP